MESQCSGWSVTENRGIYKVAFMTGPLPNLTNGMNGGEAKYITAAMGKVTGAANKILIETSDNIAFALSHVVHLFHPKLLYWEEGSPLLVILYSKE